MAVLDLSSDEGRILGHAILFWSCLGCVMYLVIFEGFVSRRLGKNKLAKLILCACSSQCIKCICSNASLNYPDSFDIYPIYVLNGTMGISLTYFSNVAYAYLLFNNSLQTKYRSFKIYVIIHSVLSFIFVIGIFATQTYGFLIGASYFIPSVILFDIVLIRLYFKNKRKEIVLGESNKSYEEMGKILFFCIIFVIIGGIIPLIGQLSQPYGWLNAAGGIWYAGNVIVAIYCNNYDFMRVKDKYSIANTNDTQDEEERESLQV